jgi:secondary thiamine-phosphate synthase enzyme
VASRADRAPLRDHGHGTGELGILGGVKTETLEIRTGRTLVTDFVPHATAGVAIIETGSGSESDLADALERLLPTQDVYDHRHGSTGHGRDHVVPAFVAPSVSVPVIDGRPALGTWQSVVLVDSNGDNPVRNVVLSFLAG